MLSLSIDSGGRLGSGRSGGAFSRIVKSIARDLWDQSGALRFKFATDEEFDRFLLARCQFGLPKIEFGAAVSTRPE